MPQLNDVNGGTNSTNGTSGTERHTNGTSGYTNGTNGAANRHGNGINGHSNGINGGRNGTNSHSNGINGYSNGTNGISGSTPRISTPTNPKFEPIAICGMACRLPGGIKSPKDLWDFLLEGRDGRSRVPKTRFNIDGYYSPTKRAATAITEHGYFLDESVDLGALDTSFFSMTRTEVEYLDPQQKLMLEVARESLDDAGEVGTKGSNIGVYVGSFGQDWYDILAREGLRQNSYTIVASHDFMLSERISHEMDLKGPR